MCFKLWKCKSGKQIVIVFSARTQHRNKKIAGKITDTDTGSGLRRLSLTSHSILPLYFPHTHFLVRFTSENANFRNVIIQLTFQRLNFVAATRTEKKKSLRGYYDEKGIMAARERLFRKHVVNSKHKHAHTHTHTLGLLCLQRRKLAVFVKALLLRYAEKEAPGHLRSWRDF
jgi:hypothetical protein